jgi:leucyl-tRNA synthetase
MWTKALYDLGYIGFDEPFKKLMNQGMIQGVSEFIYRYNPANKEGYNEESIHMGHTIPFTDIDILDLIGVTDFNPVKLLASKGLPEFYFSFDAIPENELNSFSPIHIPVNYVNSNELNVEELVKSENRYSKACFFTKDGFYLRNKWFDNQKKESTTKRFTTSATVEKMSKSKLNVVNPDEVVTKYGADTFRMYEMFLGPVEMSKPWDTKGIEGVHRFLKKLWRLFFDDLKGKVWTNEKATDAELKVLHKTIKKIEDDTERFSFNTGVSTFMIAVNELTDLKCHKKEILEPLLILLTPYAPHIAEELYAELRKAPSLGGGLGEVSILDASFPKFEAKYVAESSKEYPISINGKMRTTMDISLSASQDEVEKLVLDNDIVKKWTEGKPPKKIIYVKNKMVNVVV